ncbi:hypothetical protein [Actibacterium ureilyticum]|uniref:hypothetical protein n=1 Tax=Actibacterium ureilyticum TaxID=1590614 RepID=UPI001FE6F99F|nr:hypothetical protein [Actibacterium ureilyticum]
MKRNGIAAVIAIGLLAAGCTDRATAEPFSLERFRGASPADFDAPLFPLTPVNRVFPKPAPASEAAPGKRRGFAPTGVGAQALKQLIGQVDAGAMDYDAVQHGARIRPAQAPTMMTLAEIFRWIDQTPGQQHAIGRYQFIPKTLRNLVREAGLDPQTRFSPQTQDLLADILLEDAGFSAFLDGRISRHRFMENLARIWAAFPTSSGRSHYHGIAGNRAVISWNEFDSHMRNIFARRNQG